MDINIEDPLDSIPSFLLNNEEKGRLLGELKRDFPMVYASLSVFEFMTSGEMDGAIKILNFQTGSKFDRLLMELKRRVLRKRETGMQVNCKDGSQNTILLTTAK